MNGHAHNRCLRFGAFKAIVRMMTNSHLSSIRDLPVLNLEDALFVAHAMTVGRRLTLSVAISHCISRNFMTPGNDHEGLSLGLGALLGQ